MEYVGGGSILDMMDAGDMDEEHIKTVIYDVRPGPCPRAPPLCISRRTCRPCRPCAARHAAA
jgi:hypothetical protein